MENKGGRRQYEHRLYNKGITKEARGEPNPEDVGGLRAPGKMVQTV